MVLTIGTWWCLNIDHKLQYHFNTCVNLLSNIALYCYPKTCINLMLTYLGVMIARFLCYGCNNVILFEHFLDSFKFDTLAHWDIVVWGLLDPPHIVRPSREDPTMTIGQTF